MTNKFRKEIEQELRELMPVLSERVLSLRILRAVDMPLAIDAAQRGDRIAIGLLRNFNEWSKTVERGEKFGEHPGCLLCDERIHKGYLGAFGMVASAQKDERALIFTICFRCSDCSQETLMQACVEELAVEGFQEISLH